MLINNTEIAQLDSFEEQHALVSLCSPRKLKRLLEDTANILCGPEEQM